MRYPYTKYVRDMLFQAYSQRRFCSYLMSSSNIIVQPAHYNLFLKINKTNDFTSKSCLSLALK